MTLLWFIVGVSLVAALAAWSQARRNAKRLEHLSQMYWELKYQQGELRVQLQRPAEGTSPPEQAAPTPARDSFIPLTSLKR